MLLLITVVLIALLVVLYRNSTTARFKFNVACTYLKGIEHGYSPAESLKSALQIVHRAQKTDEQRTLTAYNEMNNGYCYSRAIKAAIAKGCPKEMFE